MEFDLIHGDRNSGHLLHVLHVVGTVVGHPDGLGTTTLGPIFQGLPLFLPAGHTALPLSVRGEVDQQQINVTEVELLEAIVQVLLGASGVEPAHNLSGHEVLLTRQANLGQGLSDPNLVPIHGRSVHVPVPQFEGIDNSLLSHGIVVLPGAQPVQGHAHGPVHPLHGDGREIRREGGGSSGEASGNTHCSERWRCYGCWVKRGT
mmetsp:Transcript_6809/g.14548  ORF Transcript_6809/g.14548 Transcript_6809/m.14548 type:complete len:204 (+) Transcript_6809:617-1228(+)